MLTVENTIRSYSGKRGCMCGCLGTYNESVRARKTAITQMLKDPDVRLQTWNSRDDDAGCLFVDSLTRTRVLYLTEAGVAAARSMGVQEEQE